MQRCDRHATAVSTQLIRELLGWPSISTTPEERHCTRAGREQASKGRTDDLTDLGSICPPRRELRMGISGPWLHSPW